MSWNQTALLVRVSDLIREVSLCNGQQLMQTLTEDQRAHRKFLWGAQPTTTGPSRSHPLPKFYHNRRGSRSIKTRGQEGLARKDDWFWARQDCAHESTAAVMACTILDKIKLVSILVWSGEHFMSPQPLAEQPSTIDRFWLGVMVHTHNPSTPEA